MNTQVIGYVGENGTRNVQIPVGHLLEKWPDLSPSILMVPVGGADDDAYPVDSELVGSDLVWHVSAADTAVTGTTKASVRMTASDGRVALDEPFTVIVSQNLSIGGEPPSPVQSWVDKLEEITSRSEKVIEDAYAAADRANDAAHNWENETAANAEKLGGKPPEYYLTPVNLLDNSWFEDMSRIINQRGFVSGSMGAANYCIDRWLLQNSTILSIESGFVRLSGQYNFWQIVPHTLKSGATYTVAARLRAAGGSRTVWLYAEDAAGNRYATPTNENNGEWVTLVGTFTLTGNVNNMQIHFTNSGDASVATDIAWVAIYEGAYTAETLPPYVPKPYSVELAECQRYYQEIPVDVSGSNFMTVSDYPTRIPIIFPTQMRKIPDAKLVESWNSAVQSAFVTYVTASGLALAVVATADGTFAEWHGKITCNADL